MIAAYKDFDTEAFWFDITKYMERWKLTTVVMADLVGMDPSNMRSNYLYRKSPSLAIACRLAAVCDLSLDKYNIACPRSHARV